LAYYNPLQVEPEIEGLKESTRMKGRNRINIPKEQGLSGFTVSKMFADLRGIPGITKAVGRALGDRYPNIWPSVTTISEQAGFSPASTRRALRILEAWELIEPVGSKRGGRGKSEQYLIKTNNLAALLQTQSAGNAIGQRNKTVSGTDSSQPGGLPLRSKPISQKRNSISVSEEPVSNKAVEDNRTREHEHPTRPEEGSVEWTEKRLSESCGYVVCARESEKQVIRELVREFGALAYVVGVHKMIKYRPGGFEGFTSPNGVLSTFAREVRRYISFQPADWNRDVGDALNIARTALMDVTGLDDVESLWPYAELLVLVSMEPDCYDPEALEEALQEIPHQPQHEKGAA
jgi:hypothetical protein